MIQFCSVSVVAIVESSFILGLVDVIIVVVVVVIVIVDMDTIQCSRWYWTELMDSCSWWNGYYYWCWINCNNNITLFSSNSDEWMGRILSYGNLFRFHAWTNVPWLPKEINHNMPAVIRKNNETLLFQSRSSSSRRRHGCRGRMKNI